MKFGSEAAFGAGYNVLPVWKERLDPKTLVTTPNSDVIYAMNYVDMGETGPIVFEAPPNLQGILLDFWQRPIPVDGGKFAGDVGLPGPDAGKGGKFLVLPPGYKGEVPDGYYVYRSATNNIFIFLRAFYQDPANLTPAVALIARSNIYPLNLPESERKPMKFPDASGPPRPRRSRIPASANSPSRAAIRPRRRSGSFTTRWIFSGRPKRICGVSPQWASTNGGGRISTSSRRRAARCCPIWTSRRNSEFSRRTTRHPTSPRSSILSRAGRWSSRFRPGSWLA